MTTEREMLEAAAKACGIEIYGWNNDKAFIRFPFTTGEVEWNPLTNSADCAAMCAKLMIETRWSTRAAHCNRVAYMSLHAFFNDHNNDREAAWRYAATMVAAKIGGMK